MFRFAANISMLWADLPWLDRIDAAADAGFKGVEALFPYDVPIPETKAALDLHGLSFVLLNAPPPNYTGGARGFAAVPGREARFDHDMRRAFRYAQTLGAGRIHVMAGTAEGQEAHETFVRNLARAASQAPDGVILTIEPLCREAMPDYFLNDYAQAAAILDEIGAPNLALQFDSYHAQMIHGDATAVYRAHQTRVRHIQFGDAPDRTAPGTGQIDFAALLNALSETGYDGWVSAEYNCDQATAKTLGWLPRERA